MHKKTYLLAALLVLAPVAHAQTATLSDFVDYPSGYGNGETLGLLQASDGNFYFAPTNDNYIFRVTPAGVISSLKGELDPSCGNGIATPLIEGPDGNLYGIMGSGGTDTYGTIFKYSLTTKACTLVYSFPTSNQSQAGPLRLGSDGNFYGVFRYGGAHASGFAYRIGTDGSNFTDLYDFDALANQDDGDFPVYDLLEGSDSNWYGVTGGGGTASEGVLYQLTPTFTTPWQEAQFIEFASPIGNNPVGGPFERADGNIYGLTVNGAGNSYGALYQSDTFDNNPNPTYYSLTNDGGGYTNSPPAIGGDGKLYFTQDSGAETPGGFSVVDPAKKTEVLLGAFSTSSFNTPVGQIAQASDGNFYGLYDYGGANNEGGMWKAVVSPSVTPPITLTVSSTAPKSGSSVTLNYTVLNVNSKSAQQCYAYQNVQQGGLNVPTSTGGNWSGKLSGTISGSTMTGSASVAATATGTYVYSIECEGHIAGLSPAVTFSGVAAVSTKTVLTATPNPVSYGSTETFSATVTKTTGPGTPTGTVSFNVGSLVLATTSLNASGVGSLTVNATGYPIGTYPITAYYKGDAADNASTSNTVNVALKNGTSTSLGTSENTVPHDGSITLTATVTQTSGPSKPVTPTGSVSFYASGELLTTINLNASGVAVLTSTTAGYPAGTYSVTAKYNGSGTENGSTSNVQSITLQ